MRVFVTGGTGLLGNTVLRQLGRTHETLALVRSDPDERVFQGIDTEFVRGDLNSEDVIDEAVSRSDAVINAAGLIHLGWKKMEQSMRVNRDGTRIVAEACLKHRKRLVHVGTVNVMAIGSRKSPSNEETELDANGGQVPCTYVLSKRAGCDEVRRLSQQGLSAVLVHPGFMMGPWDWKPSSGRMLLEVAGFWKMMSPWGGNSLCDSRDVANATIAALEKGGDDARDFILAGANWRYKKLWGELAKRVGKLGPIAPAGPLVRWAAGAIGDLKAKVTGNETDLNSASVQMSNRFNFYDSSRAKCELDYENRPSEDTLDEACGWIIDHHLNR